MPDRSRFPRRPNVCDRHARGKLAAFALAFEYLEIGGHEQLTRVAERAGDQDTVKTVDSILAQERATAHAIRASFDEALENALEAQGVRT